MALGELNFATMLELADSSDEQLSREEFQAAAELLGFFDEDNRVANQAFADLHAAWESNMDGQVSLDEMIYATYDELSYGRTDLLRRAMQELIDGGLAMDSTGTQIMIDSLSGMLKQRAVRLSLPGDKVERDMSAITEGLSVIPKHGSKNIIANLADINEKTMQVNAGLRILRRFIDEDGSLTVTESEIYTAEASMRQVLNTCSQGTLDIPMSQYSLVRSALDQIRAASITNIVTKEQLDESLKNEPEFIQNHLNFVFSKLDADQDGQISHEAIETLKEDLLSLEFLQEFGTGSGASTKRALD